MNPAKSRRKTGNIIEEKNALIIKMTNFALSPSINAKHQTESHSKAMAATTNEKVIQPLRFISLSITQIQSTINKCSSVSCLHQFLHLFLIRKQFFQFLLGLVCGDAHRPVIVLENIFDKRPIGILTEDDTHGWVLSL